MVLVYTIDGASFNAGKPCVWPPTRICVTSVFRNFDISADGKRAVIFPRPAEGNAQRSVPVTFLPNFLDELRRRVK
jgi:hypothetical protein